MGGGARASVGRLRCLSLVKLKNGLDVCFFFLADWKSEQLSNAYYLGDLLHIEASVIQYKHVPLRVFVLSCVATAVADVNASPRYSFIEENG